jgi:hypothetical protein
MFGISTFILQKKNNIYNFYSWRKSHLNQPMYGGLKKYPIFKKWTIDGASLGMTEM